MTFTPEERARLFSFLGYGAPARASFVFLGEKEYTPDGTHFANCLTRARRFDHPWEDKNASLVKLAAGMATQGGMPFCEGRSAWLSAGVGER